MVAEAAQEPARSRACREVTVGGRQWDGSLVYKVLGIPELSVYLLTAATGSPKH